MSDELQAEIARDVALVLRIAPASPAPNDAIAHELRRLYAARGTDPITTTERTQDADRRHEEGPGDTTRRAQGVRRDRRPDQGNA